MKPSQFKRIEKQALRTRNDFKQKISRYDASNNGILAEEEKKNLSSLVKTMKSLKSDAYETKQRSSKS